MFLWEGLKRLDVYPLPYSRARLLAEGLGFNPYDTLAEAFAYVPFYANTGDTVEVHAVMAQGHHFRKYAMLNVACLPCPP